MFYDVSDIYSLPHAPTSRLLWPVKPLHCKIRGATMRLFAQVLMPAGYNPHLSMNKFDIDKHKFPVLLHVNYFADM